MWGPFRFSTSIASVSDTLQEELELWEDRKRAAWLAEVTDSETKRFVPLPAWRRRFEGVEDKAEAEPEEPGMLKKTAMQMLSDSVRENIMSMTMEVTSRLLQPAEQSMDAVDAELAEFLNALNGVALTFRFEEAEPEQLRYIRTVCADRIASSLAAALERQAARLDFEPDTIDEEQLEQITEAVAARLVAEIEGRQDDAFAALQGSPLFAMASAGSGDERRVEENIGELQNVLRAYVRSQTGQIGDVIRGAVRRGIVLARHNLLVIRRYQAAGVAARAGLPGPPPTAAAGEDAAAAVAAAVDERAASRRELAEAEEAYQAVREEVLREIEDAHEKLNAVVAHYVKRVVFMVSGLKTEEEEEKEEKEEKAGEAEAKVGEIAPPAEQKEVTATDVARAAGEVAAAVRGVPVADAAPEVAAEAEPAAEAAPTPVAEAAAPPAAEVAPPPVAKAAGGEEPVEIEAPAVGAADAADDNDDDDENAPPHPSAESEAGEGELI